MTASRWDLLNPDHLNLIPHANVELELICNYIFKKMSRPEPLAGASIQYSGPLPFPLQPLGKGQTASEFTPGAPPLPLYLAGPPKRGTLG